LAAFFKALDNDFFGWPKGGKMLGEKYFLAQFFQMCQYSKIGLQQRFPT